MDSYNTIMDSYNTINVWLTELSLALSSGSRKLDDSGFWSMPYGNLSINLIVPSKDEALFILYTPLLSTTGADNQTKADFFRYLLEQHLPGVMPLGMTFATEEEENLVYILGQYHTAHKTTPDFEKILQNFCTYAETQRDKLRDMLQNTTTSPINNNTSSNTQQISNQDIINLFRQEKEIRA